MSTSVTGLSALTTDANLTAASVILAAEHNTHRTSRETRLNTLLTIAQEQQNHRASASAPTDLVDGSIWYDSANVLFFGRKSSAWVRFLDAATAYTADLTTAGTETFRLGGVFEVNTTAVAKTTTDTGVLMTYTLPAGQLARDQQYVHVVCFGTTASGQTFSLQPRFGAAAITTHSGPNNITDWCIEFWVVRTGAATVDAGSYIVFNRDDTASTTLCDFNAALTPTLANTNAIDVNVSAKGGSLTITQELLIVEWGNF